MATDADILAAISDGHFHSGQELAQQLGLSRSAIWKGVQQLQSKGIDVYAVQGKGYRLANPVELLNRSAIYDEIGNVSQSKVEIDVLWEVDSTNRYVTEQANLGKSSGYTCVAESQLNGRGRRGRTWVSPLGGNVYFSQLWEFSMGPADLSGLSLAVSLAVMRSLHHIGVQGAELKWPNDILIYQKKVAGILLEIVGESAGPTRVVVGIGVNFHLPKEAAKQIDQPYTTLDQHISRGLSRNRFIGLLINQLLNIYGDFQEHGFTGFAGEWRDADAFVDSPVELNTGSTTVSGICRGVNNSGALLLEKDGQIRSYQTGEVSLRPQPQ